MLQLAALDNLVIDLEFVFDRLADLTRLELLHSLQQLVDVIVFFRRAGQNWLLLLSAGLRRPHTRIARVWLLRRRLLRLQMP